MAVCKYHKYGHCKFQNVCRYQHNEELCETTQCDVYNCSKRHPKRCRYFEEFGRCKFGDFCSFAHVVKASTYYENADLFSSEFTDTNSRLSVVEDLLEKHANEVTELKAEIHLIREENNSLKEEVKNIFENVEKFVENIVKVTTETICSNLSTQQQVHEQKTYRLFDNIEKQLQAIAINLKPKSSQPSVSVFIKKTSQSKN